MKNIYFSFLPLFLFFLLSSNNTNAQRMDTPGNQWNHSGFGVGGPYFSSIRIGEDTLIGDLEYHKIYNSFDGEAFSEIGNYYI